MKRCFASLPKSGFFRPFSALVLSVLVVGVSAGSRSSWAQSQVNQTGDEPHRLSAEEARAFVLRPSDEFTAGLGLGAPEADPESPRTLSIAEDLVSILTGATASILGTGVEALRTQSRLSTAEGGCELKAEQPVDAAEFIFLHLETWVADSRKPGLDAMTEEQARAQALKDRVCAESGNFSARLRISRLSQASRQASSAISAQRAAIEELRGVDGSIREEIRRGDGALRGEIKAEAEARAASDARHAQAIEELQARVNRQAEELEKQARELGRLNEKTDATNQRVESEARRLNETNRSLDRTQSHVQRLQDWVDHEKWLRRKLPSMDQVKGAQRLKELSERK